MPYMAEDRYGSFLILLSDNIFTELSIQDDGSVDILSISTSIGNIYKYFCSIFLLLSDKIDRYILIL